MRETKLLLITGLLASMLVSVSVQADRRTQTLTAGATSTFHKAKLTRAQYHARYKQKQLQAKQKLDRQRAAWRKKWEAEQRSKTQNTQHARNAAVTKTLTPAQLRWRKKKARLQFLAQQKQRQLAQQKANKSKRSAYLRVAAKSQRTRQSAQGLRTPKRSYAPYRSYNIAPVYNQLPLDIVSKLRARGLGAYGVSAYVRDVNSARPLLAYQDNTARVPASVMKLITSYAALGVLGPNYRWPLNVYTTGAVRNGVLQGDLYIKGYGSPEFDTAALRKVMHGIRQKGIHSVSGRVVFDDTYFNSASKWEGSFDNKSQVAYNAKPDALLFNERKNAFQIRAVGRKVRVSSVTPTRNLRIVNKMRKTRRGCRPRIRVSKRAGITNVTFSGRFSKRCGTRTYTRVISEPSDMIYGTMRSMWKREMGGKLAAQFAKGRVPRNARPLLTTYSRTLAQILPEIDKKSNNVMARQLLLTIGAKARGQGTERNGAEAVGAWLATRGLHFPELRIENGSGLSRTAKISARHISDLLIDAYKSPYRNILMQALAIAGVDGTVKRRFRGSRLAGRGYFKTGTLRNVRSIAGYVKASDGKTYVVAILHNDPKASSRALAAHNQLIEWVFDGGREQLAMR